MRFQRFLETIRERARSCFLLVVDDRVRPLSLVVSSEWGVGGGLGGGRCLVRCSILTRVVVVVFLSLVFDLWNSLDIQFRVRICGI